jgi:DNA-binding transcriptional regulator YbjK
MVNRQPSDRETKYFQSLTQMLQDGLTMMGDQILNELIDRIETMSEEEAVAVLMKFRKNVYSLMIGYPERMEAQYEAHKADPETQAKVEKMMQDANITNQGEGNGNNGNLQ